MTKCFEGKSALVTGGTRGIGKATACALLSEGCDVWISGQTQRMGWWDDYEKCTLIASDFSSQTELSAFCEKIRDLDISLLVNNAGLFTTGFIWEQDFEKWNTMMQVNLHSMMRITQAILPQMRSRKSGRIVNLSSIASTVCRPGLSAYATSKAAILGLTRSMALDLASDNIMVNAICPAYTNTDMLQALSSEQKNQLLGKIPLGRFPQTSDVAEIICFLLSEKNTYLTGQAITIDGGASIT